MNDAKVASGVHGIGDLLQVQSKMAFSTFGFVKAVFNNKCQTSAKQVVGVTLTLSTDISGYPLVGL